MRTMRRRSSRERSSRTVVLTGGGLIMIRKTGGFGANAFEHAAGFVELLRLERGAIDGRGGGELPAPELVGQKFVQHDHAPLQSEQRVHAFHARAQSGPVQKMPEHARGKLLFRSGGEFHGWMQQKVRNHFRRIIPAEVLEVEKDYSPARLSQRVVKAEIRRAQRPMIPIELLPE